MNMQNAQKHNKKIIKMHGNVSESKFLMKSC